MAQMTAKTAFPTDKIPPQSVDVEKTILASVLLDNESLNNVLEIIDENSFYREDHRMIFSAIVSLYQRNQPADLLTVTEELKRRKQLEAAGEEVYLSELLESPAITSNVVYYARILHEKSTLRHLISASQEISALCYEGADEADEILDKAESRIFEISESRIRQSFVKIDRLLPHTFEQIEKYSSEKVVGIPSGFDDLDAFTTGFQPANLIILAARPSVGKTSFALTIMLNAAIRHNFNVALFSLEMSKEEITQRMLCAEARVNMQSLRKGMLPKRDFPKLSMAAGPLSEANIFIDDSAAMSVLELRAKARRLKRQNKIDMILVDYLQLMHGSDSKSESRQQEIAQISRSLKGLAKELSIPVIALSQLSRQVEQRGKGAKPQLSDLRESGAIEQDADVVLFIHRNFGQQDDVMVSESTAEIIIGKQRNGPTGSVELGFVKEFARFETLSHRPDDGGFA